LEYHDKSMTSERKTIVLSPFRLLLLLLALPLLVVSLCLLPTLFAFDRGLSRTETWDQVADAAGLSEAELFAELNPRALLQQLPEPLLQLMGDPMRFFSDADNQLLDDLFRQAIRETRANALAQIPQHLADPGVPVRVAIPLTAAREKMTATILEKLPALVVALSRTLVTEGMQKLVPDEYELPEQSQWIAEWLQPVRAWQARSRTINLWLGIALGAGLLLWVLARGGFFPGLLAPGGALALSGIAFLTLPVAVYGRLLQWASAEMPAAVADAFVADIPAALHWPGVAFLVVGIALLLVALLGGASRHGSSPSGDTPGAAG